MAPPPQGCAVPRLPPLLVWAALLAAVGPAAASPSRSLTHARARAPSFRGSDVLLESPLVDGHNDLPYNLRLQLQNRVTEFKFRQNLTMDQLWAQCQTCYTDLPRLRAGRISAQFWAAYVPCSSQNKDAVAKTIEQIDVIKRLVAAYPEDLKFVTTSQGILDAFKERRIGSLIGMEGGHSIDSRLGLLRVFYELGVRYMTLTHACNTPWADSSPEDDKPVPELNGMTSFGDDVVVEMNRLGMMVDISHVSAPVMRRVLHITQAPVMFSHSSARAVCDHHRNVPDDVLSMLSENRGVIMINFFSGFVVCENREATMDDIVDHINHIRMVAGVDHMGLGGDYDGVKSMPRGLEDVSKYPDLFDRLAEQRDGEPVWTPDDLKKLAGLNIIRVLREVERVRDELAMGGLLPLESWLPPDEHVDSRCVTGD